MQIIRLGFAALALAIATVPAVAADFGASSWDPWETKFRRNETDGSGHHFAARVGEDHGNLAAILIMCTTPVDSIKLFLSTERPAVPDGMIQVTVTVDDGTAETFEAEIEEQQVLLPEVPTRSLVNRLEKADEATFSYGDVEMTIPMHDGRDIITKAMLPCR